MVGDRGLISAAVLPALDEVGYDHILALRARQSKTAAAALEQEDTSGWTEVHEHLWVQEVAVPDAPRVVLAFYPQKQLEDKRQRERKLELWAGPPRTLWPTAGSSGGSPLTRWRSAMPPGLWCRWRRIASSTSRCRVGR